MQYCHLLHLFSTPRIMPLLRWHFIGATSPCSMMGWPQWKDIEVLRDIRASERWSRAAQGTAKYAQALSEDKEDPTEKPALES